MVFSEELIAFIIRGREERNLEFKSQLNWNDAATRAKIAKAAMAMANIPDGGTLVLGVMPNGSADGMTTEEFESFDQDLVQEFVNEYADPYVELSVTRDHLEDHGQFVVIQVQQFADQPVVCRKTGAENLRRGAIYTRSRRKHETAEVGSQTEMREILDRAVDAAVRRLRARELVQTSTPSDVDIHNREQFASELDGL